MRKLLITICFLLLISPLVKAQLPTGSISGKVIDEEGNALPGVTLTLTSELIRQVSAVTGIKGRYRFVGLPPGKDYALTARLGGFRTERLSDILVRIDSSTEINVTMILGAIEEEVTVTARSPIVQIKTTKVSHNVDHQLLQSLPSARDPWVVAQMAPGVVMDRENVGGSESGQQSDMIVRGQTGGQTTYNIDGMNITDPDAIGASPGYYDFDSFEEIDFTLGGADVTQQQAGINLNIVTRRAGNRVSVGGRVFWTESGFQAKKSDEFIANIQADNPGFAGMPSITDIKDFGINVGAPIIQDKLWAWLYFGVQDINTVTDLGNDDNTLLQNMGLKINYQPVPENRAEIYFSFGKKNKWGRGASFTNPGGFFQDEPQHFGNPIHKFQDEHMFGNDLFVSAKYVYANVGFGLTPMSDLDFELVPWYDETAEQWKSPPALGGIEMGSRRYEYIRPVKTTAVRTTYFNDDLLGASHEILVGLEYNYRAGTTDSEREGHMDISWNMDWGSIADFDGDGTEDPAPSPYLLYWDIDRYMFDEGIVKHYQAYIRDTISFGNFNILAGLRYDIQQPYSGVQSAEAVYDHVIWNGDPTRGIDPICTPAVRDAIEAFLPAVEMTQDRKVQAYEGGDYNWSDFSPRLGITWDIFGDGRTIAKVSYSRYSAFMDIDYGEDWRPGGFGGDIQLWWDDTLGTQDWIAELNELFWIWSDSPPAGASGPYQLYRPFDDSGNFIGDTWPEAVADAYGINYSGFTYGIPFDPTGRPGLSRSNQTGSTHTTEIQASIERELMPDLGLTLNFSWRRYDNFRRTNDLWVDTATGETLELSPDMYVEGYTIPSDISAYLPEDFPWDGILPPEAYENPWYFRTDDYQGVDPTSPFFGHNAGDSTPFDVSRPDDSWNEWYGIDIILNKRFSNRWMLNASATFQTQKEHYGATGVYDWSNAWANDGVSYSGGTFARWMVKISGIYQLPYGFNVSGFFTAREGFKEDETFSFQNRYYASTYNRRDRSQTIYLQKDNAITLPTFAKLDLRVEKMVSVGDRGKAYIMVDLFNVFNSSTVLDRTSSSWGSFYYYGPTSTRNRFSTASHPDEISDILSPFIVRFGVRFEF